jgi:exonuclease SbcD
MLIAHCADLHLTERHGESRATLNEQAEILRWIGDDALNVGAELLVCAGDIYDSVSTPRERQVMTQVVTAWSRLMPVVIVRGNHDRPADLYPLGRLRTDNPVVVCEYRPHAFTIAGRSGDPVGVAVLPWPRKDQLVARAPDASALEIDAAITAGLRAILSGLNLELAETQGPKILVGHVELGGAMLDSGQPVAARCDVKISEGDLLGVEAYYYALGHIHAHQVIGDRLCYAGSPRQCTFGEDNRKGYCLVNVGEDPPTIEHRRGPGRELMTLESLDELASAKVDGKAVRIVYETTDAECAADGRKAGELRTMLLESGAHSVKLDPRVTTTTRVRSEEIKTARTTAERLDAYWAANGSRPDRAHAMLEKLRQLESTP